MKRNDIGDSYLLWLIERVLATRRVHPPKRAITPPYTGKHSAQPSRVSSVRRTEKYASTPTIGNARSLSFPFHSNDGLHGAASACGHPAIFKGSASSGLTSTTRSSGTLSALPLAVYRFEILPAP